MLASLSLLLLSFQGRPTLMVLSTPYIEFLSTVARAMTWGSQQKPCWTPRTTTGTPSLHTSWKILQPQQLLVSNPVMGHKRCCPQGLFGGSLAGHCAPADAPWGQPAVWIALELIVESPDACKNTESLFYASASISAPMQ